MQGYRDLASDLRRRIDAGEYAPGDVLPKLTELMETYGLARQTVRAAIALLVAEGLVTTVRRRGTVVRARSRIRVPLSRYSRVLAPGGKRGPWETACAEQGLAGRMAVMRVERRLATADIADRLHVAEDSELVYRRRHALINDEIVQVQDVWYPASIAQAAGIGEAKVTGGVYGALTRAGYAPSSVDEHVTARLPDADEAAELHIGSGVPVLSVERITSDKEGTALELLRVLAVSDRCELVYDNLPLIAVATEEDTPPRPLNS